MAGNPSPSEFRRSPSTLWLMVLISLAVHVAIAGTVVVVTGNTLSISIEQESLPRSISLHPVTLSTFNLPPLKGNRDAGPGTGPGKGTAPIPAELIKKEEKKAEETQKPQPAKKEEPKVQKQTTKTPDKKPEPKKSEPAEKKQVEKKEEKPATAEVSMGSLAAEPAEKKTEPVSEIERRELRSSRYSAADSTNVSGGRVTQQVAIDGGAGGGGGGGTPETFRNVLVSLIWEKWRPKPLPLGEVKEALIEFTLYSPPVPQGARNKNRPASVIRDIRVVESSGDYDFDMEAQKTLGRLTTIPPLPEYIKEDELVVSCLFSYRGELTKTR